MELFYQDIQPKRQQVAKTKRMGLQIDLEFQQKEIKRLNEIYEVEMFSSCVHVGKAYAAEQNLEQNKNLESLRSFCSKANKHIRQLPPALDSIQKS